MPRINYGPATSFVEQYRLRTGKLPWQAAYNRILTRTKGYNDRDKRSYSDKGIRRTVSSKQLRVSFFRDKAWKMVQPSVDRIDPDGHYSDENIRWIPMSENRKLRLLGHPKHAANAAALLRGTLRAMERMGWSGAMMVQFAIRLRGSVHR